MKDAGGRDIDIDNGFEYWYLEVLTNIQWLSSRGRIVDRFKTTSAREIAMFRKTHRTKSKIASVVCRCEWVVTEAMFSGRILLTGWVNRCCGLSPPREAITHLISLSGCLEYGAKPLNVR